MGRDAERAQVVLEDLETIDLGDERLNRRAKRVTRAVASQPDVGFPQAMADEAELEGLYRLLSNDKVTAEKLIAPHFNATLDRLKGRPDVLVVHDNTEFRFPGVGGREGLSKVGSTGCGLQAHFALALATDTAEPLGVLGLDSWVRTGDSASQKRKADPNSYKKLRTEGTEQDRWWKMVEEVEARIGATTSPIHIMDSEADDYTLLANLQQNRRRFVLRLCYDRRLDAKATGSEPTEKVREFLARAKVRATRAVHLARRKRPLAGGRTKRTAPREARDATLQISAKAVVFMRPPYCATEIPKTLTIHVVAVREKNPPPDVVPVEWLLLTTEPIDSVKAILRIVDAYRARWTIEEYFKALKTGCAVEKRQLESKSTILKAIAIFTPVAWALLRMRYLSRTNPEAPATTVISKLHIKLLREQTKLPLTADSTVADAWQAIARLGGHLKQNGPAGWQVIGRGYSNLLILEAGYKLAKSEAAQRSDQ